MKKIDDNHPARLIILKYFQKIMTKGKYFTTNWPFASFDPSSAFRLIYFSKA